MKISEKIYTAILICLAALAIFVIAFFQLMMIPRTEDPQVAQLFKLVCVIYGLLFISFGTTSFINLKQQKLATVPTVIQIITLFVFVYGIPIGIWGIVLLVKSNKRANQRLESIAAAQTHP